MQTDEVCICRFCFSGCIVLKMASERSVKHHWAGYYNLGELEKMLHIVE